MEFYNVVFVRPFCSIYVTVPASAGPDEDDIIKAAADLLRENEDIEIGDEIEVLIEGA